MTLRFLHLGLTVCSPANSLGIDHIASANIVRANSPQLYSRLSLAKLQVDRR